MEKALLGLSLNPVRLGLSLNPVNWSKAGMEGAEARGSTGYLEMQAIFYDCVQGKYRVVMRG